MAHILAIDQSTSATKAILYEFSADASARIIDEASAGHRQIYPKPGWVEHDAEEIWQSALKAAEQVIQRNRRQASELLCLSITNQRETFVIFDRATGKPLRNAIVWQCGRGADICRELSDAGHGPQVQSRTGLRLDTYFSGSKLAWLVRHEPEIARQLNDGNAVFGTIDTYLIHRMTSGKVFATDHTNASRTLLYNINSLGWDDSLCRMFDVPRHALPEVRQSADQFGTTDLNGLLPSPVSIRGIMGDSQAALLRRCFEPGMAKVTFGTGSSVLLNIGSKPREAVGGAVTALAWVIDGQPTYCFEGIINYSAATLTWLKEQLGLIDDIGQTESLATSVKDNGGVYLVPAFAGLGAPYWCAEARAAIVGLSGFTGRAHVVRAALESIAYQLRDVLEMMRDHAGVKLAAIHADGGATANHFLMQFVAGIIALDVVVTGSANCSALGAATVGALGASLYTSVDQLAGLARPGTSYRPTMDRSIADGFYAGWRRAVRSAIGMTQVRENEDQT